MTRCSPAGARKNCRPSRGPVNRVLPYHRNSPSSPGTVSSTGSPDAATRHTSTPSPSNTAPFPRPVPGALPRGATKVLRRRDGGSASRAQWRRDHAVDGKADLMSTSPPPPHHQPSERRSPEQQAISPEAWRAEQQPAPPHPDTEAPAADYVDGVPSFDFVRDRIEG